MFAISNWTPTRRLLMAKWGGLLPSCCHVMQHKISVAKCRVRGDVMWRVRWHDAGRVHRKFFTGRDGADAHAALVTGDSVGARKRLLAVSQADQEQLLFIYTEAMRQGVPLSMVATFIASVKGDGETSPRMGAVVDEMIEAKRKAGLSNDYLSSLRQITQSFCKGRESIAMNRIAFADVERFIDGHNLNSRSTLRARLSTWFKFGVRRGYCASNLCERLEPVKVKKHPPRILSIEETTRCLAWLKRNPRAFGWFILTTFCGLRPEEAQQTSWREINFDEGFIRVEAQTSKVSQRRVVYPLPAGMALLRVAKKLRAQLPMKTKTLARARHGLRACINLKRWPQDVTRHTAASMWLALIGDADKVAGQLGHSTRILHRNYKALVTKAEAERFWQLS